MMRYLRLFANVSNWWLHFAVKMRLTAKDPLLFKAPNHVQIEVPRRLFHEFKEVFMEACYTTGLGRRIPQNPSVVDIGANVGFFSLFAASQFPGARIFAYEPVPKNFALLTRNRNLNPVARITCIPKAVYAYSGQVRLELDPLGCSGESGSGLDPYESFTTAATVIPESKGSDTALQIPCISLSDLLDVHGINRCDLLKIDCEGAEYDVLYHCPDVYLKRVEQMAIEVHRGPTPDRTIEELSRFLMSRGFQTRRLDNMLYSWRSAIS
jgi:FkbM family methyltransferase